MNNTGDTVATVMGWLSSTQAGGATTFHNGVDLVRLWPTRGAAGVWYSLYTDGSKVISKHHESEGNDIVPIFAAWLPG